MAVDAAPLTRPLLARPPIARRDNSTRTSTLLTIIAIGFGPAIALAIAVARGGGLDNPWVLPLAALTFMANVVIVLMDIRYGLVLFILAAGLSPKLPGVYDNLRVEDFIFVLVFGTWAVKVFLSGKMQPIKSPIIRPFMVLVAMGVFSTLIGLTLGTIGDGKYSFFLQAKRVEYFLVFYVVATTIRSEAWVRILAVTFVASGALAGLYGIMNPASTFGQASSGTDIRVMGPAGENYNTLAGYLVLCIVAGIALIPELRKGNLKWFVIFCTVVAGAAMLGSFSREGYIMLGGSLTVFGFTKHRKILAGVVIALAAVLFLVAPVRKNLVNTFDQIQNAKQADPGANSLAARYRSWEYRWNGWFVKQPILGNGVGSVALSCDNEYLLRACEGGIVGFGIFVWFLAGIGKEVWRLKRLPGLPMVLGIGLASGFVGLLIQGTVACSFNSIRTMEPFWFFLGLVGAAAYIHRRQVKEQQEAVLL